MMHTLYATAVAISLLISSTVSIVFTSSLLMLVIESRFDLSIQTLSQSGLQNTYSKSKSLNEGHHDSSNLVNSIRRWRRTSRYAVSTYPADKDGGWRECPLLNFRPWSNGWMDILVSLWNWRLSSWSQQSRLLHHDVPQSPLLAPHAQRSARWLDKWALSALPTISSRAGSLRSRYHSRARRLYHQGLWHRPGRRDSCMPWLAWSICRGKLQLESPSPISQGHKFHGYGLWNKWGLSWAHSYQQKVPGRGTELCRIYVIKKVTRSVFYSPESLPTRCGANLLLE